MSYLYLLFVLYIVIINSNADEVDDNNACIAEIPNDQIDFRHFLGNQKYFISFYKCLMDEYHCAVNLVNFKKCLPYLIESKCGKCDDTSKRLFYAYIDYIKNTYPESYENFTIKYDPDGRYLMKSNYYDELYRGTVDVTLLLENEQCLARHYLCLVGEGSCTDEGKVLKQVVIEVFIDGCLRCSRRQSKAITEAASYLEHADMKKYETIVQKFSPGDTHVILENSPKEKKYFYHIDVKSNLNINY